MPQWYMHADISLVQTTRIPWATSHSKTQFFQRRNSWYIHEDSKIEFFFWFTMSDSPVKCSVYWNFAKDALCLCKIALDSWALIIVRFFTYDCLGHSKAIWGDLLFFLLWDFMVNFRKVSFSSSCWLNASRIPSYPKNLVNKNVLQGIQQVHSRGQQGHCWGCCNALCRLPEGLI